MIRREGRDRENIRRKGKDIKTTESEGHGRDGRGRKERQRKGKEKETVEELRRVERKMKGMRMEEIITEKEEKRREGIEWDGTGIET